MKQFVDESLIPRPTTVLGGLGRTSYILMSLSLGLRGPDTIVLLAFRFGYLDRSIHYRVAT
jgi:hypothetical protein